MEITIDKKNIQKEEITFYKEFLTLKQLLKNYSKLLNLSTQTLIYHVHTLPNAGGS